MHKFLLAFHCNNCGYILYRYRDEHVYSPEGRNSKKTQKRKNRDRQKNI